MVLAKLSGVAQPMMAHVTLDPLHVRGLRSETHVPCPQGGANVVEQPATRNGLQRNGHLHSLTLPSPQRGIESAQFESPPRRRLGWAMPHTPRS